MVARFCLMKVSGVLETVPVCVRTSIHCICACA